MVWFPSGDDPAVYITATNKIVQDQTTSFIMPFYPQVNQGYNGPIFTPLLISIISLITSISPLNLYLYFLLFLFCLSSLSLFLLLRYNFKDKVIILATFFFILSRFGAETYWGGNYNQIFGLFLLPLLILYYQRFLDKISINAGLLLFLLFITIFFYHTLTFLLTFLIMISFIFVLLNRYKKKVLYVIYPLIILIYLSCLFIFRNYLKHFRISLEWLGLGKVLSSSGGFPILLLLFLLFGLFFILKEKYYLLVSWALLSLLFSQSYLLNIPFYSWRFNPFFIQSIIPFLAGGIILLNNRIKYKTNKTLFIFFIVTIFLVSQIGTISEYKKVYLEYNPPLQPPVIEKSEYDAFIWMKYNLPNDSIVLAHKKWGIYIPAIAQRSVVLEDFQGVWEGDPIYNFSLEASKIFNSTSLEANELSCQFNISHVFIGSGTTIYAQYNSSKNEIFENNSGFKKIYEKDKSIIYEVKCRK